MRKKTRLAVMGILSMACMYVPPNPLVLMGLKTNAFDCL